MKLEIDVDKLPWVIPYSEVRIGAIFRYEGFLYMKIRFDSPEIDFICGINLFSGDVKYFVNNTPVTTGKLNLSWEDDYYVDS